MQSFATSKSSARRCTRSKRVSRHSALSTAMCPGTRRMACGTCCLTGISRCGRSWSGRRSRRTCPLCADSSFGSWPWARTASNRAITPQASEDLTRSSGGKLPEQPVEPQGESWEEKAGERAVAALPEQAGGRMEPGLAGAAGPVDLYPFGLGIDHPVLGDAELLVEAELLRGVDLPRAGRQHLDDEVGGGMDVGATDPLEPLGRHEEQVRLDDVVIGEDDVQRGEEDLAEAVRLHVAAQVEMEMGQHELMAERGRRRHVVLAVDQLVPLAVLRHRDQIGIGEPGGSRRHGTPV